MVSVTTRHEFLAQLHEILTPKLYFEIGVQYGHSLKLASAAGLAVGVDPVPQVAATGNQMIYRATSEEFFTYFVDPELQIDFAFIDGSHLFEDVLRDFINVEAYSHIDTVVVFDDVLPTTQEMTSRVMVPGHWTGDTWKIYPILKKYRPHIQLMLVDTEPTGTLVAWYLDKGDRRLAMGYPEICDEFMAVEQVPDEVLQRTAAMQPAEVIQQLRELVVPNGGRDRE